LARLLLLFDRDPDEVLPGLGPLAADVKVEPLAATTPSAIKDLEPDVVVVEAREDPSRACSFLRALGDDVVDAAVAVVAEPEDLERFPWGEVADVLLYPDSPPAEISVRLAMARRRLGNPKADRIRLGALSLSPDTYQVSLDGRPLDLTYREFELLRFLSSRPGRVFTRNALLREVWGYDFFGGTRTVDVHVRRLRSKLGPEHESLIETVRGVGYRAAPHEPWGWIGPSRA
jgi:DNA-binding response OmpR family regulator